MYHSGSTGSDNSTVLTFWESEIERLETSAEPLIIPQPGSGSGFNRVPGSRITSDANRTVSLAGLLGSGYEGVSIVTGSRDGRTVVAEGVTGKSAFTVYVPAERNSWISYEVTIYSDGEIMLPPGAHVGIAVA
jgi:hypothetical protein